MCLFSFMFQNHLYCKQQPTSRNFNVNPAHQLSRNYSTLVVKVLVRLHWMQLEVKVRLLIQLIQLDAVAAAVSVAADHAAAAAADQPSSLWSGLCRPSVRRRMRRRFASAASAASGRRGDQDAAEESSSDEGEKERGNRYSLTY